ncbi:MAG: folate family ECF transporter S component [Clostridia bacterium]|nr:folate family ECF transporter S component [Clostridia bacterium]
MSKGQKGNGSLSGVRLLTVSAMLTAISVVIGIFCKTYLNFGDGLFRITFENLPIIMAGILYGPIIGGVVGLSTDLISYMLSPQIYPINIIVTIGATLVGVVSGIVSKFIIKKNGNTQIIAAGALSHVICSMIIKSIGLFEFYSFMVLLRIPTYLVIGTLEIFLLCRLLQRKSFAKIVGYRVDSKTEKEVNNSELQ